LFAAAPALLNPVLPVVLLVIVMRWARSLWGARSASALALLILCQDLVLSSAVDVMSELPATVLLTATLYALSRSRCAAAGLLLGHAGVALVSVTCMCGVWPCASLVHLEENLAYRTPFTASFLREANRRLGADEVVAAPPVAELAARNGHHVTYLLRRKVSFVDPMLGGEPVEGGDDFLARFQPQQVAVRHFHLAHAPVSHTSGRTLRRCLPRL
jgi:hypothetical protein